MKPLLFLAVFILLAGRTIAAVTAPEFEQLKANYKAAIDRVSKPLTDTYLIDLERQRDSYTRGAKLDAANVVQAEIDSIKKAVAAAELVKKLAAKGQAVVPTTTPEAPDPPQPPGAPAKVDLRWFVGKTWLTDAKTKWHFTKDNTGDKVRGKDKYATFIWHVMDSGILELKVKTGKESLEKPEYLKFISKSEAWFGSSLEKMNARLHVE